MAGGELTPAMYARAELSKYQTGLRTCRNFEVLRSGGVSNRAGSKFIAEQKDSAARGRLAKFVFNTDQTYVLVFENLVLRIVKQGGILVSGGLPYELASPYVSADLRALYFTQSADVVTITHPSYATRELRRTGDTSWSFSLKTYAPSIDAPTGLSNTAGAGTANGWVVTALKADTYEESVASAVTEGLAASGTVNWSAVTGAVEYWIYKRKNGKFYYAGSSATTSFVDPGTIVLDESQTPPIPRDPFDAVDKYPSVSSYYQQRLLLANTNNEPEKIWASRSGSFNNMTISSPSQEDDAITWNNAGRQVNAVRHMFDLQQLVVMTAGAIYVAQGDADGTLLPGKINPVRLAGHGVSTVVPVEVGESLVYVQARGSIVRDLKNEVQSTGYQGRDLTVFATHLFSGYTIEAMDYAETPNSIVRAVRSDGVLLGLTYLREHEIWGWHRHDTDGLYEDVVTVPEGDEDATYVLVRRIIGGVTRRYIERFASRRVVAVEDSFFVDSGLSYDGQNTTSTTLTLSTGSGWTVNDDITVNASGAVFTAADVGNKFVLRVGDYSVEVSVDTYVSAIAFTGRTNRNVAPSLQGVATDDWSKAVDELSGLDHLEGKTVAVLADGGEQTPQVVVGGSITIPRAASKIHVGLPYDSDLETLSIEVTGAPTLVAKPKLVRGVNILVESSRGLMAGTDVDNLREWKQRGTELMGNPTDIFTGVVEVNLSSTYNDNGRVFIRQSSPLPLSILSITPTLEVE